MPTTKPPASPPPAARPRKPPATPPESSATGRSPAGKPSPRPEPPTRQGGSSRQKGKQAPASPIARKWSFLDVYEHWPIGPWDVLFKGDVEKAKLLNPKRWAPNIEQDPIKRKRAQGPTPNQELPGWFCAWAHAVLTGDTANAEIYARHFLALLKALTVKLFGGEQNSSTYYKYYLACGAAAVKWGDAWGQPEIAKYGRKMLCDYLALLELHRTPVGIAMPGARVPRGVVGPDGKGAPEFEQIYTLLTTGDHPKLRSKKLDDGYEVAQWSLRGLGQKFKPSPLSEIGQQSALFFTRYEDGWLSCIPSIRAYDPVIAVSYVNGRLHELRWKLDSGKHKAEVTRASVPLTAITERTFEASYPQVGWKESIPVPEGRRLKQELIV